MTEHFVREWLETYNSADLEGAMACYTEDVEKARSPNFSISSAATPDCLSPSQRMKS